MAAALLSPLSPLQPALRLPRRSRPPRPPGLAGSQVRISSPTSAASEDVGAPLLGGLAKGRANPEFLIEYRLKVPAAGLLNGELPPRSGPGPPAPLLAPGRGLSR